MGEGNEVLSGGVDMLIPRDSGIHVGQFLAEGCFVGVGELAPP